MTFDLREAAQFANPTNLPSWINSVHRQKLQRQPRGYSDWRQRACGGKYKYKEVQICILHQALFPMLYEGS